MQVCKFLPVQYGASCPLKKNNVAIHNISMSPFIFTARYYNENEDSNKKTTKLYYSAASNGADINERVIMGDSVDTKAIRLKLT